MLQLPLSYIESMKDALIQPLGQVSSFQTVQCFSVRRVARLQAFSERSASKVRAFSSARTSTSNDCSEYFTKGCVRS